MITIANAQLWVHDQDEALAVYTDKLGWQVRADVTVPELGNFRWLTVGPATQSDFAVVLMAIPGPPVMDEATGQQVRDLMAKGFAGTVFLATDDVHADFQELRSRGVEFVEEPQERPYGIDSAFRDPSGNHFRLSQLTQVATPAYDATEILNETGIALPALPASWRVIDAQIFPSQEGNSVEVASSTRTFSASASVSI